MRTGCLGCRIDRTSCGAVGMILGENSPAAKPTASGTQCRGGWGGHPVMLPLIIANKVRMSGKAERSPNLEKASSKPQKHQTK